MIRHFCVGLGIVGIAVVADSARAVELFVSPRGNDAWTGLKSEPAADGKEGPLATLKGAREALRKARQEGGSGPWTITVREGVYEMQEPLSLQEVDSGTAEQPVMWRAFAGEVPVIRGAVALHGWEVWKGAIQRAPFPGAKRAFGGVRQLLLGGERQTLARYPNADPKDPVAGGWAFAAGEGWPMYSDKPGEDKHTLEVRERDWRTWAKPEEVEVFVFPRYNWWNNRERVKSVDVATRRVTLVRDCSYAIRLDDRYFFQNALEELDAPGEWYFDRSEGYVYFWPPQGRRAEEASAVLVRSLLRMEPGTHDVVWSGFTMEGSNESAVVLSKTRRCVVERNSIRSVGDWGGHGVSVEEGWGNVVRRNTIVDVGNCAVVLSGGVQDSLECGENVAEDNQLSGFGVFYKQGVGVNLRGAGNRAMHNHIHHGPRFGIMHSGVVHEVGFNHIHDVCLETEDTGAIYSNGRDWLTGRGSVIHHNYIHDVPGFSMWQGQPKTPNFAWGIYLDDSTGGVDVIGNIVLRCGRGGMHAHGARDCVVRNNVFMDNHDWQYDFHGWTTQGHFWVQHLPTMVQAFERFSGRAEWRGIRGIELHPKDFPLSDGLLMAGNVFERNVVVSGSAEVPVLDVLRVRFDKNRFDHNLYWAPGGKVRTNFRGYGPDEGENWVPSFSGKVGEMPENWRWSVHPNGAAVVLCEGDGGRWMTISAGPAVEAGGKKPIVFSKDLMLGEGKGYRLRARLRASQPGKAQGGVHCFVPGRPFWSSPGMQKEITTEWAEYEWTFSTPKRGERAWHEAMQRFNVRFGWEGSEGSLEVADVRLREARADSPWEAWVNGGADAHSMVSDPLFADLKTFELSQDSPAWKLGFERIPFEEIGPRAER